MTTAPHAPTDEIGYLTATELANAYRSRALSPVDVTRTILARIDALNSRLNAFCLIDGEAALHDARASEARWLRGEPLGPLDGVPASIKDLILTRGWPTLRGSRTVDPAGPWDVDAPATARLREAGAVLLGKTTTPEFGWRATTDSPLTGITRNPWRLDVTPGGSSGGATAAIAAGLGPLAVGTDGGGSVRIPAAFTGTVGLKAQFGRVPAYPLSPMNSVAHIGPQTRTVEDCAQMLNVLARPDVRDWTSLEPTAHDWVAGLAGGGPGLKGLRIAYSPGLGYVDYVDPEIAAAVAQAARRFEELGAIVEQVDPDIPDGGMAFNVHWFGSARRFLHRMAPEQVARLDPGLQAGLRYAERLTLVDFLDAQNLRAGIGGAMRAFHCRHDLLLTPATAVQPFAVGRVMPDPLPGVSPCHASDWSWWTPFSIPFNLTQQPALVLGCGFSARGLPLALQLVAPPYREDLCLRAGHAYQQSTDWHLRRPDFDPGSP
ncbi:MAG TPA: amidase [Burkholderiaceae bacterium]|nr:amidase [Burkholderiaceae bacterium]